MVTRKELKELSEKLRQEAAARKANRAQNAAAKQRLVELKKNPDYREYWPVLDQAMAFFDRAVAAENINATHGHGGFAFSITVSADKVALRITPPRKAAQDHLQKLKEVGQLVTPELTAQGFTPETGSTNAFFYLYCND